MAGVFLPCLIDAVVEFEIREVDLKAIGVDVGRATSRTLRIEPQASRATDCSFSRFGILELHRGVGVGYREVVSLRVMLLANCRDFAG
jgi:hypothetical protein